MIKHVKNSHAIKFHLPDNMPHVIPKCCVWTNNKISNKSKSRLIFCSSNLPFIPPSPRHQHCCSGSKLLQRHQTATTLPHWFNDSDTKSTAGAPILLQAPTNTAAAACFVMRIDFVWIGLWAQSNYISS